MWQKFTGLEYPSASIFKAEDSNHSTVTVESAGSSELSVDIYAVLHNPCHHHKNLKSQSPLGSFS